MCRFVTLFLCLTLSSAFAAVSQADLQGHWAGTLTDATGATVFLLNFTVDSVGTITGTGDGAPMNSSTLTIKDGPAGTVTGALHWFYVDTGVYFKFASLQALPAANGQLSITGAVAGSAYIAPMPPHDTGTWTLSIKGGNGSAMPVTPPGYISFMVKQGHEEKSDFSVKLKVPNAPTKLTGVTLMINSASFPVSIEQVKLSKGTLQFHVHGLNLISLLTINMNTATQTIDVPLSIVGVDAGGNVTTFIDGTVTFKVGVKKGTAKGSRASQ